MEMNILALEIYKKLKGNRQGDIVDDLMVDDLMLDYVAPPRAPPNPHPFPPPDSGGRRRRKSSNKRRKTRKSRKTKRRRQ